MSPRPSVRYICCICSYQEIPWAAVLCDIAVLVLYVALSSLLKCLYSVYSVLLLPPNWETSWNIHLLGSVGNGLANTIQLMQSHFNNALIVHLSIFKRSCDYLWQEICLLGWMKDLLPLPIPSNFLGLMPTFIWKHQMITLSPIWSLQPWLKGQIDSHLYCQVWSHNW